MVPGQTTSSPPDYENLDFKQMLASCPLDGIELTRPRELPRDLEYDLMKEVRPWYPTT